MHATRAAACILLGLLASVGPLRGAAPPTGEGYLARLVARLGDDDSAARDDASARLLECDDALPLLEAAAEAKDPEVRRRAEAVLRSLRHRLATRGLARIVPLAADGRVDLLPEAASAWGRGDAGGVLFRAAAFLAERAAAKGQPLQRMRAPMTMMPNFPARAVGRLLRDPSGPPAFLDELGDDPISSRLVIARSVKLGRGGGHGILLVSEGFLSRGGTSLAIFIVNGDVEIRGRLNCCLVICDGKATLGEIDPGCIVIARKGIHAEAGGRYIAVASRGRVTGGRDFAPAFAAEKARRPLGLVRFFEVADVGLEIDALTVRSVSPTTGLALQGLRKGDVFRRVDGRPVQDGEQLRRALRRRFAIGGKGTFEVGRGREELTLRARLTDD